MFMRDFIISNLVINSSLILFNNRWKSSDTRFNFYRQIYLEHDNGVVKVSSTYWFRDGENYQNYLFEIFDGVELFSTSRVDGWKERYTYIFYSFDDFVFWLDSLDLSTWEIHE